MSGAPNDKMIHTVTTTTTQLTKQDLEDLIDHAVCGILKIVTTIAQLDMQRSAQETLREAAKGSQSDSR